MLDRLAPSSGRLTLSTIWIRLWKASSKLLTRFVVKNRIPWKYSSALRKIDTSASRWMFCAVLASKNTSASSSNSTAVRHVQDLRELQFQLAWVHTQIAGADAVQRALEQLRDALYCKRFSPTLVLLQTSSKQNTACRSIVQFQSKSISSMTTPYTLRQTQRSSSAPPVS